MVNFPITVFAVIFVCTIIDLTQCERIIKQDPSNAVTMDRLDAILHRIDQLERSVSTLRAQCGCETQRFLDAESTPRVQTRLSAPVTSRCTQQSLKICERPGLHEINSNGKVIKVLCESDRWIVVLNRFDGSVNFHNKNWAAFKQGIGNVEPRKEFFLGLQNLYELTSEKTYELRFELEDFDGVKKEAHYSDFTVGNEGNAYRLESVGAYTGSAGDSFTYHQGQGFTTLDRDNDSKQIGSCGEEFNSAGWFKSCMEANIMGRYMRGDNSNFKEGMYWETFHGPEYSLKSVKMLIRVKC